MGPTKPLSKNGHHSGSGSKAKRRAEAVPAGARPTKALKKEHVR